MGWVNCTNFEKFILWSSPLKNGAMESLDGSFCNGLGLTTTYSACQVAYPYKYN